ncbi:MAG: hypothetical protein JWO47_152 [Candidatus Saccharibacteria bacterium]|nr:hypothetical protein [Candidatus Saccharibacteria bacterium]
MSENIVYLRTEADLEAETKAATAAMQEKWRKFGGQAYSRSDNFAQIEDEALPEIDAGNRQWLQVMFDNASVSTDVSVEDIGA